MVFCGLILGGMLTASSASAQLPLEGPTLPGMALPPGSDDLIRTEDLVVGVSRTGKRVSALSCRTGDLHTVQINAAAREEIQIILSQGFATFKWKNKVYAISARQGGWQEVEIQGETPLITASASGIEVHAGLKHYFFTETGKWTLMDLSAE